MIVALASPYVSLFHWLLIVRYRKLNLHGNDG